MSAIALIVSPVIVRVRFISVPGAAPSRSSCSRTTGRPEPGIWPEGFCAWMENRLSGTAIQQRGVSDGERGGCGSHWPVAGRLPLGCLEVCGPPGGTDWQYRAKPARAIAELGPERATARHSRRSRHKEWSAAWTLEAAAGPEGRPPPGEKRGANLGGQVPSIEGDQGDDQEDGRDAGENRGITQRYAVLSGSPAM